MNFEEASVASHVLPTACRGKRDCHIDNCHDQPSDCQPCGAQIVVGRDVGSAVASIGIEYFGIGRGLSVAQ